MQLLQSWKESFTMLKVKNLQLLVLVTLKSFVQAYGILLHNFWWLLVLAIIIEASCYYPECLFKGDWSFLIIKSIKVVLVALMCAIARPSLTRKNSSYFVTYFWRCLLTGYLLVSLHPVFLFSFGMILLFATFFYLDSYGSTQDILASVMRACKMVIYNLPLCTVSMLSAVIIYYGLITLLGMYSSYIFLLTAPFVFAWVKNIYVKRLHDQFNVYYMV